MRGEKRKKQEREDRASAKRRKALKKTTFPQRARERGRISHGY